MPKNKGTKAITLVNRAIVSVVIVNVSFPTPLSGARKQSKNAYSTLV